MHYKNAVIITGPTTVGKSEICIELARRLQGEIINSDRLYVYSFIKIGTGYEDYGAYGIATHLYGICKPNEILSTEDYVRRVEGIVPQILARGKLPIVEGCSSTYNPALIELNNRAGRPFYYSPVIALRWRSGVDLRKRIEERLAKMFDAGLMEEARDVFDSGLRSAHPIEISVVYNSLMKYFGGELTLDDAKERIVQTWLDAARMQLETFEKIPGIIWMENDPNRKETVVDNIVKTIEQRADS